MDEDIVQHIDRLVAEEHALQSGEVPSDNARERLRALEVQLDQCWDLLRQRRALRNAGQDPSDATARPADVVEGYKQ